MIEFVGCSVKGEKNDVNQDAWKKKKISDTRYVVAVADGLGSASDAEKGSALATHSVVEELEERFKTRERISEEEGQKKFQEAFISARNSIVQKAEKDNKPTNDFGTTLLAAVVGTSGSVAGAVGDGGIVGDNGENYFCLIDREEIEYSNMTCPITKEDWKESFRIRYSDGVKSIALFTDGIDNFTWSLENPDQPREEFFDRIFRFIENTAIENKQKKLLEFLDDPHFKEFSRDDKTLVVGTLGKDEEKNGADTSDLNK